MDVLNIEGLRKTYPTFTLKDVSFSLESGYIMGFIGMNGAGKTTTMKSMLNLVHPEKGSVKVLGKEFSSDEVNLKKEIGILFHDAPYYPKKRVRSVTDVVKRFYDNWNDEVYEEYCSRFHIDQYKRLSELSAGMRTKYLLTLALSHNARLFILDEPTSGLDPAARDDLLEIFQSIVEDGERSILFSTHITSDLEKCADYITYIHEGEIIASRSTDEFLASYTLIKGTEDQLNEELKESAVSIRKSRFGFTALLHTEKWDTPEDNQLLQEQPSLEDIMIHYAKKEVLHG